MSRESRMTSAPRGESAASGRDPAASPLAYLDGRILSETHLGLSWDHPGLRQGFGLFETIRIATGRAFLTGAHAQRLTDSAPALGIEPWLHPRSLTKGLDRLVRASGVREGALRVYLLPGVPPAGEETTEGTGAGLGPRAEEGKNSEAGDADASGPIRARYIGVISPRSGPRPELISARAVLSPDRRDPRGPLVGIKTISYAVERLLLARARAAGADECLRLNLEGRICEGTRSNVFLIEGDRLVTPPMTEGLLPGVTRWFILRIARDAGLTPNEEEVPVARLQAAEEAFLTSTLRGVVPLVALEGRPIGSGAPGPKAEQLARILEKHTTRGYAS